MPRAIPPPRRFFLPAAAFAASLAFHPAGHGAAFGVSPIRLDLAGDVRTGVLTVSNDDKRRLYFQAKLGSWTQDSEGQDKYVDSSDLIFFPPLFSIEPGEKRLIRVGAKGPISPRERAYRLFIEELPDPNESATAGGAQVAVRMRFGVPVFLGAGEAKPAVATISVERDGVHAQIHNAGDRQVRFEELQLHSGNQVVGTLPGWYVFPGVTRKFVVPVDARHCPLAGPLELRAVAEGKVTRGTVEATPVLCAR